MLFLQIQELEMENEKLRTNLDKLRRTVIDSQSDNATNELLSELFHLNLTQTVQKKTL